MSLYRKQLPVVSYTDFLEKVKAVKKFTSSQGKRYEVDGLMDDMLFFRRMDAGGSNWYLHLKNLYQAYTELESFETINFRPCVAKRHSPGSRVNSASLRVRQRDMIHQD